MTDKQSNRTEQLQAFLKEKPDDPFLLFALAKEYEKLEESSKALELYETLARNQPDYIGTYYHYGNLLRAMGKEMEAQEVFQLGMRKAEEVNDAHALSELKRTASEGEIN